MKGLIQTAALVTVLFSVYFPSAATINQDLANTHWRLVSFGVPNVEAPLIDGSAITLTLGVDARVTGSGGCNSYGGVYDVQGDRIAITQLISTMRACADEAFTRQEKRFYEALASAVSYELAGDTLRIVYTEAGGGVLEFVKR
jgi:heat shock protein HslJ